MSNVESKLARWTERLRAVHLDGIVGALLDAGEPLGPLGAQLLYVAQPALGLLLPRDDIKSLAQILERPGGVAWLREQLTDTDTNG